MPPCKLRDLVGASLCAPATPTEHLPLPFVHGGLDRALALPFAVTSSYVPVVMSGPVAPRDQPVLRRDVTVTRREIIRLRMTRILR